MTSIEESAPATLQSVFELYRALDQVVMAALDSNETDQATIVDLYMPGASANAGWSDEIKELFRLPDFPGTNPNTDVAESVAEALRSLTTHLDSDEPLRIPELSNLVYAIGALAHIDAARTVETEQLFKEVLQLALPTELEGATVKSATAESLFELLDAKFNGKKSWEEVIKEAAGAGLVDPEIADVPECRTAVTTVNGYECVVIDADIRSDKVKYKNLINVIDPRNWPKSYPGFFCGMKDAKDRDDDDWFDIVETAGFCKLPAPYDYRLITKLKFLKTDQVENLDARLDFDLSEVQDGPCDKKVKVDRGFINVRCTHPKLDPNEGGVLMRTRKVAHVEGISPYAQAFWLCKLGYGWAAVYAFFNPASKAPNALPPNYTPWIEPPYVEEDPNVPAPPGSVSGSGGASQSSGANQSSGNPTTTAALQVATKTAETWKDTAEFLTDTYLKTTKKWLAGQLSFGDLAKYGGAVGAKLASEPWLWLDKITTSPTSDSSDNSTGSTT